MFDVPCKLCKKIITFESQQKENGVHIITVAKMIDMTRFEYPMAGVFEIQGMSGLGEGDSICNSCLVEHKNSIAPSKTVQCEICKEYFQEITKTMGGWECCVFSRQKGDKVILVGGYGSYYDCMRFDVLLPVVEPGKVFCDKCVKVMIDEKSIEEDEERSGIM